MEKTTRQERLTAFGIFLCVAAAPLLPFTGAVLAVLVLSLLTAYTLLRRQVHTAAAGLFFVLFFGAVLLNLGPSQLTLGIAMIGYALFAAVSPWFRHATAWIERGRIDRVVVAIAIGFVLLAGSALLLWFFLFKPDLQDLVERFVPNVSLPLLIAGAFLFAMLNAAVEEFAYRGVLMEGLHRGTGSVAFALVGQAVAFGTLHINGFPRGPVGIALATIYGLMMGTLRIRSRGMLAPWVAHVVTDLVIIAILLFLAR